MSWYDWVNPLKPAASAEGRSWEAAEREMDRRWHRVQAWMADLPYEEEPSAFRRAYVAQIARARAKDAPGKKAILPQMDHWEASRPKWSSLDDFARATLGNELATAEELAKDAGFKSGEAPFAPPDPTKHLETAEKIVEAWDAAGNFVGDALIPGRGPGASPNEPHVTPWYTYAGIAAGAYLAFRAVGAVRKLLP